MLGGINAAEHPKKMLLPLLRSFSERFWYKSILWSPIP